MSTDVFISVPKREMIGGELTDSGYTTGTSSTATDYIELRIQTDTGSGATGVTRRDVLVALKGLERFIINGGKLGTDANLPIK